MTESEAHLARSITTLNQSIDRLRAELVRQDVYAEARRADLARVAEVEKDVADLQGWRTWLTRGVLAAIVLSIIPSLLTFYLATQVAR